MPVAVGRGVAAGPLGLATLVTARAGPSRAVTVIHDSCTVQCTQLYRTVYAVKSILLFSCLIGHATINMQYR